MTSPTSTPPWKKCSCLGEVHFAYLWQRSSLSERTILTAVAHLIDPSLPFSAEELVDRLSLYDIHVGLGETTAALSSLVERDILAEMTEEAKTIMSCASVW